MGSQSIRRLIAAAACSVAMVAGAAPVSFELSGVALTWGIGYGVDTGTNAENGGTLLDVAYTHALSGLTSFGLSTVNDAFSVNIGSIVFNEGDAGNGGNAGIRTNESDGLGVSAVFTFTSPLGTVQTVSATGTAVAGLVSDEFVDYTLAWTPVSVAFGQGGLFDISLNTTTFALRGERHALDATITLKALPSATTPQENNAVPEPGSIALAGAALALLGWSRRRAQAGR